MRLLAIQRILGLFLLIFSVTFIPPALIGWWGGPDDSARPFLIAAAIVLVAGLAVWAPVAHRHDELRSRDGFLIVVLFWLVLGGTASIPLMLADNPDITLTDALFEGISALTTTGATVIIGLDELPASILFYRQELQWLGGMGIIVLAVAIMPILGVGGMQLYRAEAPGPVKDSKLTPRIAETAKALWYIYLGLTVICALAYWLAGMSAFDAIAHSFSTVAIGGFSTHDESIGYFNSHAIESVAMVFMLLAGVNFALHFTSWRSLSVKPYLNDPEFRFYITIMVAVGIAVTSLLLVTEEFDTLENALFYGLFQTISIATTTGYTTAEYYTWPASIAILLLMASFIGGCAGSTGGGIKVIRFLLLVKQGHREILRLIHPNAQLPIRMGRTKVSDRTVNAVWGFFALYVASFSIMYLAIALTGEDLTTSFSAVAACMNNLGPGLGNVGANFANLSDTAKWILCFAMVLGRLEIFTLLVLLSPAFWRR